MRTLTFEQLRINLTLTFNTLDEPIKIIKRGKVVGYIVSNLQGIIKTGNPKKSFTDVSGETVYVPDPVKPIKQPKVSVSKQALPTVKTILAGISKQPTIQHHPQCRCGICNPISGG